MYAVSQSSNTGSATPPHAQGAAARRAQRAERKRAAHAALETALGNVDRRKAGARRTAWIIGGIALAFFIASLIQGHLIGIPNWVPPH